MGGIGKTIEELSRYRQRWMRALPAGLADGAVPSLPRPGLIETLDFGPNPGGLRMLSHAPQQLADRPALVVVLHGCRQTAEGYDLGSGWSELADREGFVLCLPEQRRGNNPNHCFNWFSERQTTRGSGEVASIRSMVEHLVAAHGIDRGRVFVTGLSAGGAMAAAMLAAYPDVFAAGAVIAGLPYRAAISVGGALEVMANGDRRSGPAAAAAVRDASAHEGPWPRLSVWHGTSDETVAHDNGRALVRQWRLLHGLRAAPAFEERVNGHARRVWKDATGRELIEEFAIKDFGHGAPLEAAALGQPGPFILEAGISSTLHIADFFGILPRRRNVIGKVLNSVGL